MYKKIQEFWQRKTMTFSVLRILLVLFIVFPIVNIALIQTQIIPDGLVTPLLKYFPQKCQEVRSAYGPPHTNCYTMFDKIYWSIPKWSFIYAPIDPFAMPPGHYGTMEHPSI